MRFGVCYYPEQWPRERWPVDARSMAGLGLELVRIGEFAWSSFEPERGRFEWQWLDEAIETLAGAGLAIVMCTPSATPPVWLALERPDILSVGPDGRRRAYGSRRHTCTTSRAYRDEVRRVVGSLLSRYGGHPAVVSWQVDNEMGNHDSARCWCAECQDAFTAWLRDRFGDIDTLNRSWGTAFWSQTYPDFEAVRLPVPTMTSHHPALRLAHSEFASHQSVDFISSQVDQIRAAVPAGVDITTNFYAEDTAVDQQAAASLTGVAAIDSYPHGPRDPLVTAYHLDLARGGAGREGRLWVMEQQAGPINWTPSNPPVAPGQIRAWTWQAALHGVDTLLYFRWRAARFGQEMYHSGLLRQDGSPTEAFEEIAATIREIRSSLPAPPAPRVGMLHSAEDVWALEINPHLEGLRHRDLQIGPYRALRALGLDVSFRHPTEDLTDLDWVVAPALHLTDPERVLSITRALEAGTGVVLGPRSLVIDRHHAWSDLPLPAGLADLLQARVVDHLAQTELVVVAPWGTPAGSWTDVLDVSGAEVLVRYGAGTHLEGRPAAVRTGRLVYAGFAAAESWTRLLAGLLDMNPMSLDRQERFTRGDQTITVDCDRGRVDRSANQS